MLKFQVFREARDLDRGGRVEAAEIETWIAVEDVFSVRADADPEWAVLTFRPGAGPRQFIVRGAAETVAAAIGVEQDRQRQPVR